MYARGAGAGRNAFPGWRSAAAAAALLLGAGLGWVGLHPREVAAAPPVITVYKSPLCGCCQGWIDHMVDAGFVVRTHDTEELATIKTRSGVPPQLTSCHTSLAAGYAVEGHVPADVVRRLLAERPPVRGIGVRGMPVGSPGMEQGGAREPYAVLAFDRRGQTSVFARK